MIDFTCESTTWVIDFSCEKATLQVVNFKGQNDTGKLCLCYVPQRQTDINKLLYLLLRFLAMQNIQFY